MIFVFAQDVLEDSDAVVLLYFDAHDGSAAQQADITSITYKVIDTTTGSTVSGHDGAALDKTVVIFDTLQTHPRWTFSTGFNFKHQLLYTAFPTGDVIYSYEVTIVWATGGQTKLAGKCRAQAVLGS